MKPFEDIPEAEDEESLIVPHPPWESRPLDAVKMYGDICARLRRDREEIKSKGGD